MQLTFFTDYGLRTLMYLAANSNQRCSVRGIAEHYNVSRNHLVKVVHRLTQLGYIISIKGKGGGIQLAHDAGTLGLGDLVKVLEPNMDLVECFNHKTNTCTVVSACALRHYLADAHKVFLDALNQHTLADLIKDKTLFLRKTT